MGSYIGKHDSPTAETGRPRAVRNPREQLRERLSRPNHAVPTPIRRLSFAGEPVGTVGRFTITPQRHYPLQQPGVSSVGVLPPVKWDGFSKKNVLSPRNSSAALSPVTVKIARPDHSTPSMEHLSCAGLSRPPADPCSRESVLRVLRESRKRDVEEEDRSFVADQRSKRRRNDSGGSAHSAFEPLLPNGTPSQLVPKPGSLKRGLASLADESIMKRSRTSSISSGSGAHAPRGTLGSRRNAIQSSYSSSLGLGQWKRPSAPSSPLSSPGSSRCQTPEGSSKRPRYGSAGRRSAVTPAPSVPVLTSSASAGSGGKRKRKIPLVSSLRDDQISLPPPPELGYTITVKDLDEEKKAGISKIQKVLETPGEKTIRLQQASHEMINLDPSPGSSSSSAAANPLLEALKMKIIPPASSTPSTSTTAGLLSDSSWTASSVSHASLFLTCFPLRMSYLQSLHRRHPHPPAPPPAAAARQRPEEACLESPLRSAPPPLLQPPTPSPPPPAPAAPTPCSPQASSPSSPSTPPRHLQLRPLQKARPPLPPSSPCSATPPAAAAFGQPSSITSTDAATTVPSSTAASMFGGSTSSSTAAPSPFAGLTNPLGATPSAASAAITQPTAAPTVKSLFGAWSAPSSTSSSSAASVQAPNAGSTFQFGAAS
uniref:POM121 transmembrane nucleoporin n=1 Tax=Salarias fasciatus TaxID=181472 RepID=A0A672HK67_SALFA